MQEIFAPARGLNLSGRKCLFLAGGITGCPDWQRTAANMLHVFGSNELAVLNPRRADFPMGDRMAGVQQIEWEHAALARADMVVFWFPRETLCPITLYELGVQNSGTKRLVVGVHAKYGRKLDVQAQTRLARPEVHVEEGFPAFLYRVEVEVREMLGKKLF